MTENITLSVQLLGGFRIASAHEVLRIDQPRLQRLLVYLLLHRRHPRPRQQIAFTLWPDTNEEQALKNLRTLLTRLRQSQPELDRFLEVGTYALHWRPDAPFRLDVADFETACTAAVAAAQAGETAAASAAYGHAVQLYVGDLTPGWYDEWIVPERERLRQMYLDVLEQLARLLECTGRLRDALGYAQQLQRTDPLHEAAYRQLMQLHLALDDRASALRVYHTCATTLRNELGVDPSPATQALYLRLLTLDDEPAAQPQPAAAPPAANPTPNAASLVGRQAEWATLKQAWQAAAVGRVQLVLISGEAGIGKTRLAEELLAWVERQGVVTAVARCYASGGSLAYAPVAEWLRSPGLQANVRQLDGIWRSEAARLLPELLADRPDLPPPGPMTEAWQRQRFFQALGRAVLGADAGKVDAGHTAEAAGLAPPRLLLLDDGQWCDRDTLDWLHFLIQANATVPLLVLATVRVEEVGEDHPLSALRLALARHDPVQELHLVPLNAAATSALAAELLGYALAPAEAARLFQDTEGNPLFVVETVRAGMAEAETKWVGEGLRQAGAPVAAATAALPPKVRAVIRRRLALLSPGAQALAETAAVIGREFTFDVLARASGQDEAAVMQSLDELWRRQIAREQGADAYNFSHDKIRGEVYAAMSSRRRRLLHREVAEALASIQEHDLDAVCVQIASHYESAGQPQQAIDFYFRAAESARRIYANEQAVGYYQHLLHGELAPRLTAERRTQAMLGLGQVWRLTGMWPLATAVNREALSLAEQKGLDALYAEAQEALASILRMQGLYGEALDRLTKALTQWEQIGNGQGVNRVLWNIGEIYWYQGDHPRAVGSLTRQLELAATQGDGQGVCNALGSLAMVYWSQGDLEQAEEYSLRSIAMAETIGDRQALGRAHNILGNVGDARRDYVFALQQYREFYVVACAIDDQQGIGWALHAVGLVFAQRGDFQRALAYILCAMAHILPLGDKWSLSIGLHNCGRLLELLGHPHFAEEIYRWTIAIAERIGMPGYHAGNCLELAELLFKQGRFDEAAAAFGSAQQLAAIVAGEWLAGGDVRFKLALFDVQLRHAQCQVTREQAVSAIRELLAQWCTPEQQADLHYAVWVIDPALEADRVEAADFYGSSGATTSFHRFRRRYHELTGQSLPEPPPLPDLPDVSVELPVDLEVLMTRLRSVLANLEDSLN